MEIARLTKVRKKMLTRVDDHQQTRVSGTEKPRFTTRLGTLLAGLAVLALISVPSAHANTFQFSFTANDLVNALKGDANQNDSATFAIFLDPTSAGTTNPTTLVNGTNYTYGTEISPVPTGADDWQAITDSNNPFGLGTELYFGKTATEGKVTVVANTTAWNTYYTLGNGTKTYMNGYSYSDTGSWPIYWGSPATIDSNMFNTSPSPVFTFTLVSNTITNGETVTFSGQASQVEFCPATNKDVTFQLQLTAVSSVP